MYDNPISIIIVHDQEVVRSAVRAYLETQSDFRVVGEAASEAEVLMLGSELIPDIVLLELIMPDMAINPGRAAGRLATGWNLHT